MHIRVKVALLGVGVLCGLTSFIVMTQRSDMDMIRQQYVSTLNGDYTQKYVTVEKDIITSTPEETLPPDNQEPETLPSETDGYLYGDKGPRVPLYLQGEGPWATYWPANAKYGTNIANSGCGYTSLAMAISYLTGREILPNEIADIGVLPYHTANQGIGWGAFTGIPPRYGLRVQGIGHNIQALADGLKQGKVAVTSIVKGDEPDRFSTGAHIICIRGVTEEGNFLVNNPNARGREQLNMEYPPDKMQNYIKQEWLIWKE